jgi:AraC-like DNA-binding protein
MPFKVSYCVTLQLNKDTEKMGQIIYSDSLLVAWTMLFIFGICLIFAKTPKTVAYKNYSRSRTILGVALIFFGVQILLQWLFDFRTNARHFATALNITCFYLEAILFGMSFISLLNPSYICRRQVCYDFGKWAACMIMMWMAVMILKGTERIVVLIVAAAFFFCDAVRITVIFFRTYHRVCKSMEDYYADNVKVFVAWLSRSTYGIVFFGLTGAVVAFAPKDVIAVQMLLGIAMFIYIFISFLNYTINYAEVEVATEAEDDEEMLQSKYVCAPQDARNGEDIQSAGTETTPNVEMETVDVLPNAQQMQDDKRRDSKIEQWIADGGFLVAGLTVEAMASVLGTNRTYVSNYINSRYECSFYDWVGSLRLSVAKRLLVEKPDMTLEEVALQSGFTSQSNFTHYFKSVEKIPPGKWRKIQLVG